MPGNDSITFTIAGATYADLLATAHSHLEDLLGEVPYTLRLNVTSRREAADGSVLWHATAYAVTAL